MPNLGRLDGDPSLGAGKFLSEATLADLPGLIEGAHLGKVLEIMIYSKNLNSITFKQPSASVVLLLLFIVFFLNSKFMHDHVTLQGLGRNFLRHLRRTRLLVHVVDAAAEDPVSDYRTVKEVCLLTSVLKFVIE